MRRRLLLFAWVLVVVGLGWWVLAVTLLDSGERANASGFGQFVLAAVGLVIVVGDLVVKAVRPVDPPDLDELTDRLALHLRAQWEQAAADRGLVQPAPLPVRWRRSTEPVAGPVVAAVGDRGGRPPFEPLPGLVRVTAGKLRNGTRNSLHRLYGGLPSGRLVVVGGPGAGKSSTAVLLLLDALRYRDQVDPGVRAEVPVPVLTTLADWDPTTVPLADWVVGKLAGSGLSRGRRGTEQAARLLRAKRVALFLDGLDEVPPQTRAAALRALSAQADVRVVLLSRTSELVDAAAHQPFVGAVAVQLEPLRPADVADHLLRHLTEPAPAAWQAVAAAVADEPGCPVAQALTTPLGFGLLRDVHPATAPVDRLLDVREFRTAQAVVDHLLDEAVRSAYTPRPGEPPPPCSPERARSALAVVATHLTARGTRDLAWWKLPEWVPLPLFSLLAFLPTACGFSALFALGLFLALTSIDAAAPMLATYPLAIFTAAFLVAFALAYLVAFLRWAAMVVVGRLHARVPPWLRAFASPVKPPQRPLLGRGPWRFKRSRLWGLAAVPLFGVVLGSATLVVDGTFGLFLPGFVVGAALGLAGALVDVVVDKAAVVESNPLRAVRSDWAAVWSAGAVMAVVGLGAGGLVGWEAGLWCGLFGAVGALSMWIDGSSAWRASVAQAYLWARYRTPLRLLRFLEGARTRHLVRLVGPVYQFRHATLQDRLAGGPASPPADREAGPTYGVRLDQGCAGTG
ncbi:hypothetical protein AB0I60_04490 [Actinosynnema sp. NPDC050436]|uniref:hypothetical protein n=1 Tax=Actinosynnema sp. NPDC050436 TaxID=3155659 RepID=UPI0033E9CBB5